MSTIGAELCPPPIFLNETLLFSLQTFFFSLKGGVCGCEPPCLAVEINIHHDPFMMSFPPEFQKARMRSNSSTTFNSVMAASCSFPTLCSFFKYLNPLLSPKKKFPTHKSKFQDTHGEEGYCLICRRDGGIRTQYPLPKWRCFGKSDCWG